MSEGKMNAEKLTTVYLKIKDKRSELSAEFNEKDAELSDPLDKVKGGVVGCGGEEGGGGGGGPAGRSKGARGEGLRRDCFTCLLEHVIGLVIGLLCMSLYFSKKHLNC